MIFNIVDKRENKYRWKRITAIIEPIWQANCKVNGDIYPQRNETADPYKEIAVCSVAVAVATANELDYPCTLFLYDEGKGINEIRILPYKARESANAFTR